MSDDDYGADVCEACDMPDWHSELGILYRTAPDLLAVLKAQGHRQHRRFSQVAHECKVCKEYWPCPAAKAVAKAEGREG